MNYKYIFILSAPRSGSTLLRVTLNKIADIVSPPETYFIEFYKLNKYLNPSLTIERNIIIENWLQFRNHLNDRNLYNKEAFRRDAKIKGQTWKDIFDILIEHYAIEAGKVIKEGMFICEKTPVHIEFQEEIMDLFPEAKIIYLIRDPRDVVASLKTCPWGTSSILRNARYWNNTSKLINKSSRSIIIKYEDLVDNPDKEFERISSLLEINLGEVTTKPKALNEERESVDPKNLASYKPIDKSYKDKWKTILSEPDHELQIIENICFSSMRQLGYNPINSFNKKLSLLTDFQSWIEKQYKRVYRRIL